MLLLPSSLPCWCVVWGCLVYTALSPLLLGHATPPPPVCTGTWLLVFGLLGWLLGSLVGCWWMGSWAAEFGLFFVWLVGCMVRCLLASCWGVCTGAVAL